MIEKLTHIYYLHRGDNSPFYVGKTVNLYTREKNHKLKFGGNIILEELDIIPSSEWKFWEKYWINQLKQWGFNLTNQNEGGGGNSNHSQIIKNKISKALKGKPKPPRNPEHNIKISQSGKGIKKPGTGRKKGFSHSFDTIQKIITSNTGRKQSLETIQKRISKTTGLKRSEDTKLKMREQKLGKPGFSKPVKQYDLEGNLIKTWSSVVEAANTLNIRRHGIITNLTDIKSKTYKGCIWKY